MRLTRPFISWCGLVAAVMWCGDVARAQERVLTKAIEVRALTPAEAESGIKTRLRGVVVFIESTSAIFVQDDTSTTFFRMPGGAVLPAIGDEIALEGKTRMGLYLPGLDYSTYRVLGHGSLPPGLPVGYDDLVFSRYHYQRVAVEGIVHALSAFGSGSVVRLAMGSRVIEARVEKPAPAGKSFVDCRVRITGLAAGLINTPRRQLVQPYIRAIDWNDIEVLEPAPPLAEVPQVSAEELLAFRVTGHGEKRVRIDGIVTAVFPDQVFLQQGTSSFAVRLERPAQLRPGDHVTVAGFPAMDRFSASVVDAEQISRDPGQPLPPRAIDSLDELFGKPGDNQQGKYDGTLVAVHVTVLDAFKIEGGTALLVQGGQRTLQARLPEGASAPPSGSRVRIVGICQVESAISATGFASKPGIISLRVPNAADVTILKAPSWWTARRLGTGLGVLAAITLIAALWIAALRRQVRRQTDALRRRIESEAALEERQRIAREFHDTLEQELAGVSLRLDALATRAIDEKGRGLIEASRNLVSRIQSETRDLISDLRDPAELSGDVEAVLRAAAERLSTDSGADVQLVVEPRDLKLPATTIHDLRMITRESVNNALTHGGATRVRIQLRAEGNPAVLTIQDNGRGFDVAAANGKRGHFGCAGIRERCRKLGATVTWRSAPGNGATVDVVFPLASLTRATEMARVEPGPSSPITIAR